MFILTNNLHGMVAQWLRARFTWHPFVMLCCGLSSTLNRSNPTYSLSGHYSRLVKIDGPLSVTVRHVHVNTEDYNPLHHAACYSMWSNAVMLHRVTAMGTLLDRRR